MGLSLKDLKESNILKEFVFEAIKSNVNEWVDERVNKKWEEKEKVITIGRIEINELKEIVKDLGQAQKRTEIKVEELVEAQKESQKEISRLDKTMQELAEAQKRTEIVLAELTKSHLALSKDVQGIKEELGGLSHTVGFTLENAAYKALPELLEKDFNIIVKDRMKRGYLLDNEGKYIEVNIFGNATKNGDSIMIIGESKSQLSKNKIDDFIRKKLNRFKGVFNEIFPLLITHATSESDAEEYAKQNNIALYYSYDF